jgi:hypothetical protein
MSRRVGGRRDRDSATLDERCDLLRRAVPDDELVAGLEQPYGDARPHRSEPDDGDLHRLLSSTAVRDSSQATTSAALRSGAAMGSKTVTIAPPSATKHSRR